MPLPLAVGRAGIALALAVAIYLVSNSGIFGNLAITVLVKIVLVALYPVFLWKWRVLSPSEISTLGSMKDAVMLALGRFIGPSRGKVARAS